MVSLCCTDNFAMRSLSKSYSLGGKLRLYKDLLLFSLKLDVCDIVNNV
ncbi:hypothetical protein COO91_06907 [Nostoc flagelliforme CCNUN1]|uniref:Uncharacterized protein n=1 Tax=Nostoc flagelliforme CCNUN1 TaxID=2038116 RepID=A0A2K8SZU6_9NOSO|nr:hypothetical protein COO91_06907 [Nostoc flagelliforme CCNUN1]